VLRCAAAELNLMRQGGCALGEPIERDFRLLGAVLLGYSIIMFIIVGVAVKCLWAWL
jgi:hypothetical protein